MLRYTRDNTQMLKSRKIRLLPATFHPQGRTKKIQRVCFLLLDGLPNTLICSYVNVQNLVQVNAQVKHIPKARYCH